MYLLIHNSIALTFSGQVIAQKMTVFPLDTLSINRFEYVLLETTTGTTCSCYIGNPALDQKAILTVIGAPDSVRVYNQKKFFKGVHILEPQEEIIVVTNFQGKDIRISNLSRRNTKLVISLLCPSQKN